MDNVILNPYQATVLLLMIGEEDRNVSKRNMKNITRKYNLQTPVVQALYVSAFKQLNDWFEQDPIACISLLQSAT